MPPSHIHSALPRLGLLGLGWIGRRRLRSLVDARVAHIAALADPRPDALDEASTLVPEATKANSLEALLREDIDGLVIATPSGLHCDQAKAALSRGLHVFCQKPLAPHAADARQMIDLARRSDRLLGVDYSYRRASAFEHALALLDRGDLGRIYAVMLTFHNAYGPDKDWSKDRDLAGGGCLIDLGVHMVDFALRALHGPNVRDVAAHLFAAGKPLSTCSISTVEDFASASFNTDADVHVRLECSWWHHGGQDAQIEARFVGTRGSVVVRNVNGSFYDFTAERLMGNSREQLVAPPDAWEGRTIVEWVRQLAAFPHFDTSIESTYQVASVIDRMYAA